MPYIPKSRREFISISTPYLMTKGELAYLITRAVTLYLDAHGIRYSTLADVEGVLQTVSKEVFRRVTAPYEDKKCRDNGDVFNGGKDD